MEYILAIVCGYLVGSIPFSFVIVKMFKKVDLRTVGSGNCGATNVYRAAGIWYAIITALLDACKAGVVYLLFLKFYGAYPAYIGGFLAVFGHCYSFILNFNGGKGVATGLGLLTMASPITSVVILISFAILVYITHYVSLSSIIVSLSAPFFSYMLGVSFEKCSFLFIVGLFIVFKHKPNIERLLRGEEKKIY